MEESQIKQKSPASERAKQIAKQLLYRSKKYPIKTFFIVCGMIIVLQFLLLPFGNVRDLRTKNPAKQHL